MQWQSDFALSDSTLFCAQVLLTVSKGTVFESYESYTCVQLNLSNGPKNF